MPEARLLDLLAAGAGPRPEAPCLLAPEQPFLTYAGLYALVRAAISDLVEFGVKRGHRIAAVCGHGFEMACAFLSVTDLATLVPLKPDQTEEAFHERLSFFGADALLIESDQEFAAQEAAARFGIPTIMVSRQERKPFVLRCDPGRRGLGRPLTPAGVDGEIALLLSTSGTTARPKIVPRTHANLLASARCRARAFGLREDDRHLTILPLFRGNSFNAFLTMLAAGGSTVNVGNIDPSGFFPFLETFSPTWFTAGPAVLESIADHAEKHAVRLRTNLRFIRSTGSPLTSALHDRLSRIFNGIPVYVTYGLTETGTVACNHSAPFGPREGSVGVAVDGCEIGIMDDAGMLLAADARGEVVVRGPNVLRGYLEDPETNRESFRDGWFRTGDEGYLDQDGYLYLTGRLKETINRGGEKVSPFEVEKAILAHPDVLQAVVFPVPNPGAGECVAAAVVLRDGACLTLRDLRRFLRDRIGFFKMPTRLYRVAEIPVGSTGKIQRNDLHRRIEAAALPGRDENTMQELILPRDATEARLAAIWQEILAIDEIGVTDDFFDLGGDSLSVARLYAEIETIWGCKIPLAAIYEESTIEHLALAIKGMEKDASASRILVPIQTGGRKPPLFCVHPRKGDVVTYRRLAHYLGGDQPVYGFRIELDDLLREDLHDIQGIAARYIREMRSMHPEGPYLLAGYSLGGKIAYEMACQLQNAGVKVAMLAIIDTQLDDKEPDLFNRFRAAFGQIRAARAGERAAIFRKKARGGLARFMRTVQPAKPPAWIGRKPKIVQLLHSLSKKYRPRRWKGEIAYFMAEERESSIFSAQKWSKLATFVKVTRIPGGHGTIITEPHVRDLARALTECIETACAACDGSAAGDPDGCQPGMAPA